MADIKLYGRIFITADIRLLSGLIIGGNDTGLEIGGVDKVCIRNPLTGEPYIPGSSLRGKMRSQLEKMLGRPQNHPIGQQVKIHSIHKQGDEYTDICHVFGVAGEFAEHPTLLTVRDVALSEDSRNKLKDAKTALPFAELKTEVAIDRVTAQATPRTLERVPAGAVFSDAEWVYSIYSRRDFDYLKLLVDGLQLVEDDYLGGAGSRGSGKVKFENIAVRVKAGHDDWQIQTLAEKLPDVKELAQGYAGWSKQAQDLIRAA